MDYDSKITVPATRNSNGLSKEQFIFSARYQLFYLIRIMIEFPVKVKRFVSGSNDHGFFCFSRMKHRGSSAR
jgi:hypothetical protein